MIWSVVHVKGTHYTSYGTEDKLDVYTQRKNYNIAIYIFETYLIKMP